ncbi:unnamed protein product [Protopolystoma xenopodis]|uniref:Uncharacterized protein n=1 Tax=Protopolystoma xenopodis TaxID=117903 RepID=A0A3S5BP37_9PLAT|nr:unnamed protein product [Protopolystoma xenopodis]
MVTIPSGYTRASATDDHPIKHNYLHTQLHRHSQHPSSAQLFATGLDVYNQLKGDLSLFPSSLSTPPTPLTDQGRSRGMSGRKFASSGLSLSPVSRNSSIASTLSTTLGHSSRLATPSFEFSLPPAPQLSLDAQSTASSIYATVGRSGALPRQNTYHGDVLVETDDDATLTRSRVANATGWPAGTYRRSGSSSAGRWLQTTWKV